MVATTAQDLASKNRRILKTGRIFNPDLLAQSQLDSSWFDLVQQTPGGPASTSVTKTDDQAAGEHTWRIHQSLDGLPIDQFNRRNSVGIDKVNNRDLNLKKRLSQSSI